MTVKLDLYTKLFVRTFLVYQIIKVFEIIQCFLLCVKLVSRFVCVVECARGNYNVDLQKIM